jgi:CheY-specific phosphatase CheX
MRGPPSGRSVSLKLRARPDDAQGRGELSTLATHPVAKLTDRDVEALFTRSAFEAGMALFLAYDVTLEPTELEEWRKHPQLNLVSVIGFAGKGVSGSLVLGATHEPLERSKPSRSSERDWIAELANQLLGRIKNKVLRAGIEFYAMPPAVVSGSHLAPVASQPDFRPWVFATPGGVVCLWIEVNAAPELEPDVSLLEADIPAEGDMLLF